MSGIPEFTHHGTGCSQLPTAEQMLWLLSITSLPAWVSLPCWKHLCLLQWTGPSISLSPEYLHILATLALYLLYDLKFTSQCGLDYTCRITSSARRSPSFKLLPLVLCILRFFTYILHYQQVQIYIKSLFLMSSGWEQMKGFFCPQTHPCFVDTHCSYI